MESGKWREKEKKKRTKDRGERRGKKDRREPCFKVLMSSSFQLIPFLSLLSSYLFRLSPEADLLEIAFSCCIYIREGKR